MTCLFRCIVIFNTVVWPLPAWHCSVLHARRRRKHTMTHLTIVPACCGLLMWKRLTHKQPVCYSLSPIHSTRRRRSGVYNKLDGCGNRSSLLAEQTCACLSPDRNNQAFSIPYNTHYSTCILPVPWPTTAHCCCGSTMRLSCICSVY